MPGAYTTFDTLSLELGELDPGTLAAPLAPLPVLACLPEVVVSPSADLAPANRHVDSAHSASSSPTQPAATPEAPTSFEYRTDAPVEKLLAPIKAPIAKPVAEPTSQPTSRPPTQPPPAAPGTTAPTPTETNITRIDPPIQAGIPASVAIDEPQPAWLESLLKVEAAIAPYAQIIVLITLLGAVSLALVLLRGGNARLDSGEVTPTSPLGITLAGEPPQTATVGQLEAASTGEQSTLPAASKPTVKGPVGVSPTAVAEAPPITPVKTIEVNPIEPLREPRLDREDQPQVALTPGPYPTTGASSDTTDKAEGPADESKARYARLPGHVLPYEQQTK